MVADAKTPLVSVVIPARNAERFIARAIGSVLAQRRPADEILVVDDGSTDNTAEAVRAFGNAVRLIQQPNRGVSVARNSGIAAAGGQWIAFLDADDEWLPDKLDIQLDLFERFVQARWGYGNFLRAEGASAPPCGPVLPDRENVQTFYEDYFDAYCRGLYAWTGTLMAHRTVFETVGVFEPGMKRGQDNDLWFRIAYRFPQVGYVPQPLAVYHLDTPDSSTKINDGVDYMIDLVERHRTLSARYDRAETFAPCITHMLQVWIRQLAAQYRNRDARTLLERFENDLPPRFCREMAIRLRMPRPLRKSVDWYLSLKKKLPNRP